MAYSILLAGVALVAFGSSYYHFHPDNRTLFWDRLPMTIVFMSLLATTIGERISFNAGRLLLVPLLAGEWLRFCIGERRTTSASTA